MRREKAKKKSGVAGVLVKLVLVVLVLYAGITLYQLRGQMQSAESDRQAIAAQVADLQAANESLRADIAEADDPAKLEAVAREELGMVKSGEKVFYDENY